MRNTRRTAAVLVLALFPAVELAAQQLPWTVVSKYVLGEEADLGSISDVRVSAAGEVFVLDTMDSVVRIFGADGTLSRTIGGAGEGPHELDVPMSIAPRADGGVFILDRRGLVALSSDGDLIDRWALDRRVHGRSRRLEAFGQGVLMERRLLNFEDRSVPVDVDLLNYVPGGPVPVPLHTFAGTGIAVTDRRVEMPDMAVWNPVGDGLVAVGTNAKYELLVLTGGGEIVGTIRRAIEPLEVTQEMRDKVEEQMAALAPAGRDILAPVLGDQLPVITSVFGGPNGSIVVARARHEDDGLDENSAAAIVWDVFSADGDYHGYLIAPPVHVSSGANGIVAGIILDPTNPLEMAVEVFEIVVQERP